MLFITIFFIDLFFFIPVIFKVKLCIFNETIIKNCTYLTVHLPNAQIKTCFQVLWFNYELKIETGNKEIQNKTPH